MVALPRSARFTCWTNSWLSGSTSLDEADDAIRGSDAAHHLIDLPEQPGEAVPLLLGLGRLRQLGARHCSLAMPAPGDPLGLAGPAEFTTAAVEAGEAVVVDGAGIGLVPLQVGAGVQWQVYRAQPPVPLGFAEAATELTRGLHDAIEVMSSMPVEGWRPELAEAFADLRGSRRSREPGLPPGYRARAETLAVRASTCLLVCDLVAESGSGVVGSAGEVESRRSVLRSLESAARRGLVAAVSTPG